MKKLTLSIIAAGVLTIGAQTFPTTPQHETYDQAIQYQKAKDRADALQARKDAGETAMTTRTTQTRTAKSKTVRKSGQADRSKSPQ